MSDIYRTVYEGGEDEIEEKKSRFIAHVRPVRSEEEASAFIAEIKKKYWDARHNCSAFIIGKNSEIMRSSDDGEPSGTAGKPILEVLLGEGLTDTAVVVTRYFGGTLLGTGGLIRAYTQAAQAGLAASVIIEKRAGIRLAINIDYTLEGKIRYFLSDNSLTLENSEYSDRVMLYTIVDKADADDYVKKLTELTGGRADIAKAEEVTYADAGRRILLF